MEQFELIRSDWQTEKDSLESVLMKLRQELKTREEKFNAAHVGKVPQMYSVDLSCLCLN